MEFRHDELQEDMISQNLSTLPVINVISKEDFNSRVDIVFDLLYQTLSRSFGPGGAGTFVSIFPKYFNTKDGFTIMKNLAFDKKLDQVICDMVMDICSRLNYTVGDGTTTAVIATNTIYKSYRNAQNDPVFKHVLPREVIAKLNVIKDEIITGLNSRARQIRSDDPEELAKNIRDVVWVSSNGDEVITEMISDMYRQLQYPAITCTKSTDGITRCHIVDGYKTDVTLTDKIYINNDDNTMHLNGANVIIFDHKVTKETYEQLLKPMAEASHIRQKKLVCIAPYYDDIALSGVIRTDLMAEHKKTGDISLVLTACRTTHKEDKVRLTDLAMLMNTPVITPHMESTMIKQLESGAPHFSVYDFDNRGIDGILIACMSEKGPSLIYDKTDLGYDRMGSEYVKDSVRIGYCDHLQIGLKGATFKGFYYDETEYNRYMSLAKAELEEIQRKVETIGTFSFDLLNKQERVFSLGLKTGVIEVGASSEISQSYLKDMVDDAVKAAESAYKNGVVLGCNITTTDIIMALQRDASDDDPLYEALLSILYDGFVSVYRTVLQNVTEDSMLPQEYFPHHTVDPDEVVKYIRDTTYFKNVDFGEHTLYWSGSIFDTIIDTCVENQVVLDCGDRGRVTTSIVNSAETDKEIIRAVVDLLSLLITGNQIVLR